MITKSNNQTPKFYIDGILNANIAILSRAITLVESTNSNHQKLAQQILDGIITKTGNSFRLGITGVPGVGKSTFIESFGKEIISQGHKLAVLAIDPSSSKSKGSILGDKTRMEELTKQQNVFIRPSPSNGTLGGVAKATYETILLCEAAGFDFIVIETVGVGQSETMVSKLTDFFLLLMLAGAGDELQGIKRGIMEMADSLVITKADGTNIEKAKMARAEYAHAIHLFPPTESGWIPKVLTCSSTENKGIKDVYNLVSDYKNYTTHSGYYTTKRKQQQFELVKELLDSQILQLVYQKNSIEQKLTALKTTEVKNPFSEIEKIIKTINN
ncbi:MAG: methylmalonyl Co-A mutase-associated GTPase MeaB [Bacteroidota bacterium]|nr:methylmalonyl Co-A mutase-associated GTPase MeaB [Bacteroidota bacterium]